MQRNPNPGMFLLRDPLFEKIDQLLAAAEREHLVVNRAFEGLRRNYSIGGIFSKIHSYEFFGGFKPLPGRSERANNWEGSLIQPVEFRT
jgi:hypothetical protein